MTSKQNKHEANRHQHTTGVISYETMQNIHIDWYFK